MTNWNSLTWCWQYVSSLLALIKIVVASQHKRQRKKSLSRFVDSWKHRLGLESALAALCKLATCSLQTFKNLFLPYSLPSLWKIWQLSLFDHPAWCVWIRADICRWDGVICSKKKIVPYHTCAQISRLTGGLRPRLSLLAVYCSALRLLYCCIILYLS